MRGVIVDDAAAPAVAAAHPQAVAQERATPQARALAQARVAGQAQVVDDLDVRAPGPGEVLVGIRAAGLCHSDLSVIDGTIPFPRPVVLGHEGAGVVEAVGEGVRHVAPGDHVALSTIANCGACPECARGRPTMCRSAIGRPERPFLRGGKPLHNFAATSAFAERTVVKAVQAAPIPRDIPLTSAALIGCGVLTGVGAVLNRAKVGQGESVVVLGVGGIGLNVLQGARIAGAAPIVAVDANPAKEDVARRFGATHFVTASPAAAAAAGARGGADASVATASGAADTEATSAPADAEAPRPGCADADMPASVASGTEAAVREILPDGAAHTFECVGSTALVRQAIDLLDRHGQAVLLGMPAADAEATFLPAAMFLDKSVLGCRYGSSRPSRDIALYADLYRQGRLLLDELVTEVYPIEDFDRAAHDAHQGRVARAVLTF
ncbi:alcohol dehydrogenase catalytic domain-containing protein [Streptomyces tubbatahanensis]|uniref:Alcohol dehydrogenase catalytic domain-containing protein n=1 Tax=Streptomyces tubbatahanensis TaxID=2923272 RepID=A0ABY3XT35_9ACTN|nr:alcohol dehydrogenase catalytic domain-containing protein [Streptomyces tubbatahanensis]UNS97555.1 alcohol dehydrogenase catalytic domain-containing protein [Streptomyces tubbatahanensis]